MSKRKSNGDATVAEEGTDAGQTWGEKKRPQPRLVRDPETGEMRPERKAEKFVRLATHRGRAALKRIKQLESLANRSQYSYTEAQAEHIIDVLVVAVERVRGAFHGLPDVDDEFSL